MATFTSMPPSSRGVSSNVASMSSAISAATRAFPATSSVDGISDRRGGTETAPILTFVVSAPLQRYRLPCLLPRGSMPSGEGQSICRHLAFASASSRDCAKFICSWVGELTPATNTVPGKCVSFSAIRFICSRESLRGSLSRSSSRTRASERLSNSSLALLAKWWNRTSPSTPTATANSATVSAVAQCLILATAPKNNAANTTQPDQIPRRENISTCALSSSTLFSFLTGVWGLIVFRVPYGSRAPGRRDRLFWVGVGLWVLYGMALLIFILRA